MFYEVFAKTANYEQSVVCLPYEDITERKMWKFDTIFISSNNWRVMNIYFINFRPLTFKYVEVENYHKTLP